MKRIVIIIVALLLVGGAVYFFFFSDNEDPTTETAQVDTSVSADQEIPKEQVDNTITIAAAGDMLPHDTVNLRAQTDSGYDYKPYFSDVAQYLDADITYCNQESPSAGESFSISGYPSFNAPFEFAEDLQAVGCNVINLANNHINDRGPEGVAATIDKWTELNPLAFAGANKTPDEQAQPRYFEVKGVKFAFIAFTDLSNAGAAPHSVNMFSESLVTQLSQEAAKNADYVIASAHWGVEDSSSISQSQKTWAKLLADNGVDLIIGAGPHVLQPVEIITAQDGREVPVWYSLGNFLSSQLTIEQLTGGVAIMELSNDNGKLELESMSFKPTYMHYEWTSAEAAAEDLLARNNLKLYPLNQSQDPLSRSLFNTTVEEQTTRITNLLNQLTNVQVSN